MKATLEFSLPDEQSEFDLAIKGGKYFSVLWDILQLLREKGKYGTSDTIDLSELIKEIYDEIIPAELKDEL